MRGLKHLLKIANRLYASCRQRFPGAGKEPEARLILKIKIDALKTLALFTFYRCAALLLESFFLNSSAC
jgi:hypothetical protein